MTPTATYIAEENCLQELPQFEPLKSLFDNGLTEEGLLKGKAYLATLRKIPCENKCKEVFKDGEVYTENVHYKVCIAFDMKGENGELCAIPLVSVSEDELWREVLQEISNDFMTSSYAGSWIETDKAIAELKQKYSLTKR